MTTKENQGCRKEISKADSFHFQIKCGDLIWDETKEYESSKKIALCPECKAKNQSPKNKNALANCSQVGCNTAKDPVQTSGIVNAEALPDNTYSKDTQEKVSIAGNSSELTGTKVEKSPVYNQGEIEVFREGEFTFWKKKGAMCASRDIVELAKLIKEGWKII